MYIVIEIQTNADGTVSTIVTQWNDRNQAESKFHSILAYAAGSELPVHSAVLLTNDGLMLRNEFYKHEVTE